MFYEIQYLMYNSVYLFNGNLLEVYGVVLFIQCRGARKISTLCRCRVFLVGIERCLSFLEHETIELPLMLPFRSVLSGACISTAPDKKRFIMSMNWWTICCGRIDSRRVPSADNTWYRNFISGCPHTHCTITTPWSCSLVKIWRRYSLLFFLTGWFNQNVVNVGGNRSLTLSKRCPR